MRGGRGLRIATAGVRTGFAMTLTIKVYGRPPKKPRRVCRPWATARVAPTESFSILRRAACPHATTMARRLSGGGLWAARPTDSENFAKKTSQSLPPVGGKKLSSFFTATCAWGKIPLRLPVWNLSVMDGQIMRAADCKPFVGKIRRVFRQYQKKAVPKDSLF